MLSPKEKQELLNDAKSAERREAFKKTVRNTRFSDDSLDPYLKFLRGMHKIFDRIEVSYLNSAGKKFRL